MKKTICIALVGLLLTMVTTSAMAAATGIQHEGKVYTFYNPDSTNGTYMVDGITFIIKDDYVTIKEDGKPDEVLQLYHSLGEATVVENKGDSVVQASSAVNIEQSSSASVLGSTEISSVVLYDRTALSAEDQRETYAIYTPYGLNYDEADHALYYQGKRVRIFEDEYPLANLSYCVTEKLDLQGTIDIIAKRDLNYQLTGLYVLSEKDFSSRDVSNYYHIENATTAVAESGPMMPSDKKELYDAYAYLGLTYDVSTDILTYQGKTVRGFMDVQQSNGEAMNSGRFSGMVTGLTNDFGEINVETVRDFTKLDAEGNGTLIGLTVTDVE